MVREKKYIGSVYYEKKRERWMDLVATASSGVNRQETPDSLQFIPRTRSVDLVHRDSTIKQHEREAIYIVYCRLCCEFYQC